MDAAARRGYGRSILRRAQCDSTPCRDDAARSIRTRPAYPSSGPDGDATRDLGSPARSQAARCARLVGFAFRDSRKSPRDRQMRAANSESSYPATLVGFRYDFVRDEVASLRLRESFFDGRARFVIEV